MIIKAIKAIPRNAKESIKSFRDNPINGLGSIIPMLIGLVSLITGVIAYIKFITSGGYSLQLEMIKQNGFKGIRDSFTTGTTSMMVSGVIGKVLLALFLAEFILILINYFKNREIGMRIAMIIDLIVAGIVIALPNITDDMFVNVGLRVFSEEQILQIYKGLEEKAGIIVIIYGGIAIATLIFLLVFIIDTAGCKEMVVYMGYALACAYIIFPLFFLFLQNVIPLVSGVVGGVALVVIGALFIFGFKIIVSSNGEGGATSSSSGSSSGGGSWSSSYKEKKINTGNFSERGENKRNIDKLVIEKNCAYVPDLNRFLGIKLWKVHGIFNDYVASDNGAMIREICSLELFEKGEFHIYEAESGREVKSSEIPWKKQN